MTCLQVVRASLLVSRFKSVCSQARSAVELFKTRRVFKRGSHEFTRSFGAKDLNRRPGCDGVFCSGGGGVTVQAYAADGDLGTASPTDSVADVSDAATTFDVVAQSADDVQFTYEASGGEVYIRVWLLPRRG